MRKFAIISLFIFILFFIKSQQAVNAQINDLPALRRIYDTGSRESATSSSTGESRATERKQARTDKLEAAKVRACEIRQNAIKKRSEQIVKRARNQVDVFSKIAQRVKEFYQNKLVPQGKIVSNYDRLVADIESKEALLAPLLYKAQVDAASFSCDRDRPSDQVLGFNQDMRAVIAALNAYRKSVRNLIAAVKGVVGLGNSATSSAQPLIGN